MNRIVKVGIPFFALAATAAAKPIPAELFGQNIEHTRSALQGGLSAQLVRNRKFAGKPSRAGVAMMWEPYGTHAVYDHTNMSCTRHAAKSRMWRQNERHSQVIGGLAEGGEAGIRQGGIGLRGGVAHNFRAVVRSFNPEDVTMVLRVTAGGRTLAERAFTVNTKPNAPWDRIAFDFTPDRDATAEISIGVKGKKYCVVGAVSLMPADNFRGMRADVVENLREIGTSVIRWPGGNFAGEYRWRDGLIPDPDERAPLQSYMEIESQPHGLGYDQNDIGMEDVLALCERIGAQPFFTLNAAWESPQDSADWVKACRGRVKLWSLGNEMGYHHMEGPKGAQGYAQMVRPHAEAMLKVDPTLTIVSSGPYPRGGDDWINNCAKAMADVAPVVSYHRYDNPGIFDFSTPERTAALFDRMDKGVDRAFDALRDFRRRLPNEIGISYDEWNIWYSWYHEEGIIEGLYAAKMLNGMMRNWEACGLRYVCYFQPINEQAINVSPFESHLTSLGEAMRLWKGHVGGVPAEIEGLPDDAFVTDAPDGSRYMTFYNFSTTEPRTFRIPTGSRNTISAAETLVPNGFEAGCRYARKPNAGKVEGGFYVLTLPPACQACARLVPCAASAKDRQVGLFYFLWLGEHGRTGPYDISKILAADPDAGRKPDSPVWGGHGVYHHWGEPLYGYYFSNDEWVVRRHMKLIMQSGVDFLFFDTTNAVIYERNAKLVMRILKEYHDAGWKIPKVMFYTHSASGKTVQRIYDAIYGPGFAKETWFKLDGKPVIVAKEEECSPDMRAFFTVVKSQWPNEKSKKGGWPWMDFSRPQRVFEGEKVAKSVMNVSVAQHPQLRFGDSAMYGEKGNRGRAFHDGANDPAPDAWKKGGNFREQWERAIEADPDIVLVTGWNEWIAGRWKGRPDRPIMFVDCANFEYSRDIEMMRDGYGDAYFLLLRDYVRRYKRIADEPAANPSGAWKRYCCFADAAMPRDAKGYGTNYVNRTQRNAPVWIDVAHDSKNISFRVKTAKPIEGRDGEGDFMRILVDGKAVNGLGKMKVDGDEMTLEVPRAALGLTRRDFHFGFKFVDSTVACKDPLDWYELGVVEPLGRINFAYYGK